MTLYQLIVYALLSSSAVGDSDRMAAQFHDQPTLKLASAGQTSAPTCVNVYCIEEACRED